MADPIGYRAPSPAEYHQAVEAVLEKLKPALAGQDPAVQGGVLAECFSLWLAGHPDSIRDDLLRDWLVLVRGLTIENAKELRPEAKHGLH